MNYVFICVCMCVCLLVCACFVVCVCLRACMRSPFAGLCRYVCLFVVC